MNHDLNTRMAHLRMALSDPRLTNRQQKMLTAICSYMPFDTEEGWILSARVLSGAMYFGRVPSESQLRNTRRVLQELEDLGLIERMYADQRILMHGEAVVFVNWEALKEPYREALRALDRPGHPGQETGPRADSVLLEVPEYLDAHERPLLRVVK